MLAILREDAARLGLENLVVIHSDWLKAEISGEIDVVFCSMSPALSLPGGFEKVLAVRGAQAFYLGWNGLLRSAVLTELYERYRVVPKNFESAKNARAFLDERGVDYRSFPVEGTWRVNQTKEALTDSVLLNLSDYGAKPDLAEILAYLEKFRQPDGQYLEVTDYKIQMLLWRNH
jgi:hypothetical protein